MQKLRPPTRQGLCRIVIKMTSLPGLFQNTRSQRIETPSDVFFSAQLVYVINLGCTRMGIVGVLNGEIGIERVFPSHDNIGGTQTFFAAFFLAAFCAAAAQWLCAIAETIMKPFGQNHRYQLRPVARMHFQAVALDDE